MVWFLDNMQRLAQERASIKDLKDSVDWLQGCAWQLEGTNLVLEAVLLIEGHSYELTMTYPALFPDSPPAIKPKDRAVRWSEHQYGEGGTLCLEWRPDTWSPEILGSQVLESAYKLLYIEQPLESEVSQIAPSDHRLSMGQELRNTYLRLHTTSDIVSALKDTDDEICGTILFSLRWQSKSLTVFAHELKTESHTLWREGYLPKALRNNNDEEENRFYIGVFSKTELLSAQFQHIRQYSQLEHLFELTALHSERYEYINSLEYGAWHLAVFSDVEGELHCFLWVDGQEDVYPVEIIYTQRNCATNYRISSRIQNVSDKSVAIVGLGSIGSKIAASLARTNVKKFRLVDDDIFLPENLCRNELDGRNIGEHKVEAVKDLLRYISRDIEVQSSIFSIGGQESSSQLDRELELIKDCDVIIDATANPIVFNLLGILAERYQKPLLWAQVFGGGIGGLLARYRPGRDASPSQMRQAYILYADQHPFPSALHRSPYSSATDTDDFLSAIDSDVSLLAAHMARLAVDTMVSKESSYPYSIYLLGFEKAWVFQAPFDTIPINCACNEETRSQSPATDEEKQASLEFVEGLLQNARNASDSTP